MTDDCPDYAAIKALAAGLGRPAATLIALSGKRDPFYVTPGRLAAAQWFADVWALLNPPDGVHLRRLHYRLVSLPQAERPKTLSGDAYENTEKGWNELNDAAVDARALGLVDAAKFTDRRAGEPIFVADDAGEGADASVICYGTDLDDAPVETFSLSYTPAEFAFPMLPAAYVSPPRLAEPYALEIWAEKSTMNDVLEPLARRLNVTLVTGVGELSVTHCLWQVKRALAHGKKARILYISDFDPAGAHMPVSVARKIEHILRRDGHDALDIRLDPIVLTREQVRRYALPRIPIKDSDRGKTHFEDRFGEGAVELDALEALHQGELARIVAAEIAFYRDPTREATRENSTTAGEAWDQIRDARDDVYAEHDSEIADMREAFAAMQAEIAADQQALAAIAEEAAERSRPHVEAINVRIAAFYERATNLWGRIREELEDSVPDADDFAWVEPEAPDEDEESLFDSQRDYVEQIDAYKAHQGKPTTARRRRP
jgi:hypothetical protein